jgi:hypothetical protein
MMNFNENDGKSVKKFEENWENLMSFLLDLRLW